VGVALTEAVDSGLLKTSIRNARMLCWRRSRGKNDMLLPIGRRARAHVWDPITLAGRQGLRGARGVTQEDRRGAA
jgi:hypothetical protein